MARRPCLDCPTLAPTGRARCPDHERQHERTRRPATRQAQGYGPDYQRARAALHLEDQPPCSWGCGRPATTADHWPPKAAVGPHTHLVPACHPCNSGHVAQRRWNALTDTERTRLHQSITATE